MSFPPVGNKEGRQRWSGVRLEKANLEEGKLEEAREGFPTAGDRRGEARIKEPGRRRKIKPSSL